MPRVVDHEKYREELLYKCFDLIATRGYYSITMREIAKELNISTGSLYHYFPNKEGMMKNMLEIICFREMEKAYLHSIEGENIGERIDRLLKYVIERESFFKNVFFLAFDYSRTNRDKDTVEILNRLVRYIQEKITEGGFGVAKSFGSMMPNLILGILAVKHIAPGEIDIDEQIALSRDILGFFYGRVKLVGEQNLK